MYLTPSVQRVTSRPIPDSAPISDRSAAKPPAARVKRAYQALSMTSIGLEMGLAVVVGLFAGQWLDGYFGTEPYLMLFLLGCGIAAAFKALWRAGQQAKRVVRESDEVTITGDNSAGLDDLDDRLDDRSSDLQGREGSAP